VSRFLACIVAVALVGLTVLFGLAEASTDSHHRGAQTTACHSRLTVIAHGQGSPDDLVWDGKKLLVSDINKGTIGVVAHGHVTTLVSHLDEPEGIVPGPNNSLIVAEQGTNSVVQIGAHGSRRTLAKLPLPSGKEGVDGINADGTGAVYVPDSARGRLYVLNLSSHKLTLVASGMNRPVAAIPWDNSVVVADEYANAVWRIRHTRTHMARVPVPDDLTVISGHLISTGLVGEVWEVAPHLRLLTRAFSPTTSDPQGMVADGPDSLILAVQSKNSIYRLSALSGCL
jgi:DNA-binding beta-propeller fold protein YncE